MSFIPRLGVFGGGGGGVVLGVFCGVLVLGWEVEGGVWEGVLCPPMVHFSAQCKRVNFL